MNETPEAASGLPPEGARPDDPKGIPMNSPTKPQAGVLTELQCQIRDLTDTELGTMLAGKSFSQTLTIIRKLLNAALSASGASQQAAPERLAWLHGPESANVNGYEWGIFRVKWEGGKAAEVWQTLSDFSDLDEAMALSRTAATQASPVDPAPAQRAEPPETALRALARRCLWIAYCWNEHNFGPAHEEARKTAQAHGIDSFEEANEWIDAHSGSGQAVQAVPERAAFEEWCHRLGMTTSTKPDVWGNPTYLPFIEAMWDGWNARAALSAGAQTEQEANDGNV